jgi:hypothetical protein
MSSARWVGRRHKLAAKEAKALRWLRRASVMRMRPFLERLSASWRALKSPADPLMAVETNRSLPRTLSNFLWETRLEEAKSVKIWASSSLRWGGNSMVCRTVSMIQPSMVLRVVQLLSPLRIFLTDKASVRLSPGLGWARTSSTAASRWLRRARRRLVPPCPTWMKSSTKTSV